MDARSLFPLTLSCLGADAPAASSPGEFVRAVCERYAQGDIPSRSMRDLVHFEAMLLDLPDAPPRDDAPLREGERVVLAPHVRVLVFGGALPEVVEALRKGEAPRPRPYRGWIVVWREGGKVREHLLPREEGWILERFREPTVAAEAVEDDEEEIFDRLRREGVLIRA